MWWTVLERFDLAAWELGLLVEAVRVQDRCDRLAAVLEVEGLTATGSKGQTVAHPALAEARQQELALARLVAALRFPEDPEADERPSRTTRSGRPQRRGGPRRPYGLEVVGGA
jgi:hypothetical protein